MNEISAGCKVIMHFSLTLEDGTVAEDSFNDAPLEFVVGDGTLDENLEQQLYGMRVGDEATLTLAPEQAFGFHDPKNIHTLPRSDFDATQPLTKGMVFSFTTPAGHATPGIVKQITADSVTVDFNHPFAGRNIIYKIKILDIRQA